MEIQVTQEVTMILPPVPCRLSHQVRAEEPVLLPEQGQAQRQLHLFQLIVLLAAREV